MVVGLLVSVSIGLRHATVLTPSMFIEHDPHIPNSNPPYLLSFAIHLKLIMKNKIIFSLVLDHIKTWLFFSNQLDWIVVFSINSLFKKKHIPWGHKKEGEQRKIEERASC